MVKICFTGIMKNEGKNVYRCLDGVKPIIDFVSICDTGSTDNTVELIKKWGEENNIPTIVHIEPFKNFEYNRTLSAKQARESFDEADYLLLLDADMVLVIEDDFDKESLTADEYKIKQKDSNLEYYNTRMVCTSKEWIVEGVTHEYWSCKEPKVSDNLNTLWINDIGDGGCKDDKYVRDERLLLDALNDPETKDHLIGRYMFYLAQTYKCMGKRPEAIHWYKKRFERGGWEQENFYCQYIIGCLLDEMDNKEAAVGALLMAWNLRPSRAEPLQKAAEILKNKGQYNAAMLLLMRAKDIPFSNDILFVDHNVYNWQIDYDLFMSAYYVTELRKEGVAAYHRLKKNKHVPQWILDHIDGPQVLPHWQAIGLL